MFSLKNILKINAISSGATGILLILFARTAASIFDVNTTTPFTEVGIFLTLFAIFVFTTAVKKVISSQSVRLIIVLDTLWVVSSTVAILALYPAISLWGTLIIVAVALWVASMAVLQSRALKAHYTGSKGHVTSALMVTALLCFGQAVKTMSHAQAAVNTICNRKIINAVIYSADLGAEDAFWGK